MELIIGDRGIGKTAELIIYSDMFKIPIIAASQAQVDYIIKCAKERNLQIPKPITVEQMWDGYCRGRYGYENVLVDDAYMSGLLESALNQYLHASVKACVIDNPKDPTYTKRVNS